MFLPWEIVIQPKPDQPDRLLRPWPCSFGIFIWFRCFLKDQYYFLLFKLPIFYRVMKMFVYFVVVNSLRKHLFWYSCDDYKELWCTVRIPLQTFKEKPANRRYKYHVVSPSTRKKVIASLEFISGPKTKSAKIIDRCLKLYINPEKIQYGSK